MCGNSFVIVEIASGDHRFKTEEWPECIITYHDTCSDKCTPCLYTEFVVNLRLMIHVILDELYGIWMIRERLLMMLFF